MVLFIWTILALVAFARAGPGDSNRTYNGNDGDWRADPQSDPVTIEPLTNPACADGTMARVIGQGMSVDLFFTGSSTSSSWLFDVLLTPVQEVRFVCMVCRLLAMFQFDTFSTQTRECLPCRRTRVPQSETHANS